MFKQLLVILVLCTTFLLLFSGIAYVKEQETASLIDRRTYSLTPIFEKSMCYIDENQQKKNKQDSFINQLNNFAHADLAYTTFPIFSLTDIKKLLENPSNALRQDVILKVLSALKCAEQYHIQHNQVLTIIDYSLPSNEKRLWIFDLFNKQLLFHTYVSHGIKSGTLFTNNFSNKNNSKATSMGVYTTEQSYYGRDGISLRLDGLDRGFNDNAANRSIVMHGGWYVNEYFIKKYGRAGRSWGCPAVPLELTKSIINTIKEKSIFIAYYPNDDWFSKSRFLKCSIPKRSVDPIPSYSAPVVNNQETDARDDVVFAEVKNNKQLDTKPVVAVSADRYEQIFHQKAPVGRMLRRQINGTEYIAVSNQEFKKLIEQQDALDAIQLVEPVIKEIRGYYETQLRVVDLGKIQDVTMPSNAHSSVEEIGRYTIRFEKNSNVHVRSTDQFVRWVGL